MAGRSAWDRGVAGETYAHGRPPYLAEGVAWAAERAGLPPDGVALDLAAGTGRLSRELMPLAGRVIAVEPGAGMRTEIAARVPDVELHKGTAEAIPLPDASVDAVFVGDAFHWFDGEPALAEMRRVLRPTGGVAVFWSLPALGDALKPLVDRLHTDLRPYREAISLSSEEGIRNWYGHFERADWLEQLDHRGFERPGTWEVADVRAYVCSWSHVAGLEGEQHDAAVGIVDRILADAPAEVSVTFRTEAFAARRC